jgi:hypothetical protein
VLLIRLQRGDFGINQIDASRLCSLIFVNALLLAQFSAICQDYLKNSMMIPQQPSSQTPQGIGPEDVALAALFLASMNRNL